MTQGPCPALADWLGWLRVCVRTGVACVWLRAVCASVCVWNVLSVCVMRLVCRPGVSMKILKWIGCDEGETCGPGVGMKILKLHSAALCGAIS